MVPRAHSLQSHYECLARELFGRPYLEQSGNDRKWEGFCSLQTKAQEGGGVRRDILSHFREATQTPSLVLYWSPIGSDGEAYLSHGLKIFHQQERYIKARSHPVFAQSLGHCDNKGVLGKLTILWRVTWEVIKSLVITVDY